MKKVYTFILIALLLGRPLLAFATDDILDAKQVVEAISNDSSNDSSNDLSNDLSNDSSTNDNVIEPSSNPTDSTNNSLGSEDLTIPTPAIPDESISDDSNLDVETSIATPSPESDDYVDEILPEDDAAMEDEVNSPQEHIHSFEYISNNDSTHIVRCVSTIEVSSDLEENESSTTVCDFEEQEACTFDDNNICIYCGYVKPEEPEEFNPTISVSLTNQTCTNGLDPVICLAISQVDYDISYAQVCFANYSKNQFINIGLAQGKYFNTRIEEFVYTSDSNWYASPNIVSTYDYGDYYLRSIFVRASTGESVHYSLETDSLPEEYQNIYLSVTDNIPEAAPEPIGEEIEEPVDLSETDSLVHQDTRLDETEYIEPIELVPSLVDKYSDPKNQVIVKPDEKDSLPDAEIINPIDKSTNSKGLTSDGKEDKANSNKTTHSIQSTDTPIDDSSKLSSSEHKEQIKTTPTPSESPSNNSTQKDSSSAQEQNTYNFFNNIFSFFKRIFRF